MPSLTRTDSPDRVKSTQGDMRSSPAGGSSPLSRSSMAMLRARLPPAESPPRTSGAVLRRDFAVGGERVLESGGKGMLGRQAIARQDHAGAKRTGEVGGERRVDPRRIDAEAAAVYPDDARGFRSAVRDDEPGLPAGHGAVTDIDALRHGIEKRKRLDQHPPQPRRQRERARHHDADQTVQTTRLGRAS